MHGPGESSIYVDDLDAAEGWYNTVLQLETAFRNEEGYCFLDTGNPGPARGYVVLFDPDYTGQQTSPPRHGTTDDIHFAFDVPVQELDEWRDHLERHNVKIEDDIRWHRDHSIYFRDPFNNSLELYGIHTA